MFSGCLLTCCFVTGDHGQQLTVVLHCSAETCSNFNVGWFAHIAVTKLKGCVMLLIEGVAASS
jgi:hypothetical protein